MASELNDVVRHVILRIIVDQGGLADELAKAQAKLKALKDAEKASNKEREKNNKGVTDAIAAQNKALDENKLAHEAAQRAATGEGNKAAEASKAKTEAIKAETKGIEAKTVAEAKAAAINAKTHQDELDRIAERSQAKKNAVKEAILQDVIAVAAQAKLLSDQALEDAKVKGEQNKAQNIKLNAQTTRTNRTNESIARAAPNVDRAAILEATKDVRQTAVADSAISTSETAKSRAETAKQRTESAKVAAAAAAVRLANAEAAGQRAATKESERLANIVKAQEKAAAKEADTKAKTELREAKAAEDKAKREAKAEAKTAEAKAKADAREVERLEKKSNTEAKAAAREVERLEEVARKRAKADAKDEDAQDRRDVRDAERAKDRATREENAAAREVTRLENKAKREAKEEARQVAAAERQLVRDARAAESQRKAYFKQGGIPGSASRLLSDFSVAALRTGVAVTPLQAIRNRRRDSTTVGGSSEIADVTRDATRGERAVHGFFNIFKAGAKDAEGAVSSLGHRFLDFLKDINRPRFGGSGGGLFKDLVSNFTNLADRIQKGASGIGKHLFTTGTAVVAVIGSMGPLAALLGSLGAAALGLASNLGALSGVLLALPGLIGAAVAGFGALALVLKPVTSVFSAYNAAQKEAATSTKAATSAALAYKEAVLNQKQAEVDYNRAVADGPRNQQKLNDARRQAARDIQDYRTQLSRLKFDEEGAALGTESAELEYRKTLADPTATNLDRRIALHNVQGAKNDQADQATSAKRLQEDSSEAFKKGVDGADAVVDAQRAVEDQTNKVALAYINWQQSIIAVQKAQQGVKAGGGTAAATYQAELDKLPPKTKAVVFALIGLKDEYKKMRDRLSENIFGPVSKDTGKFRDILKSLESFLTPASKAIGILLQNAVALFTNPSWKAFFSEQGEESGKIIGKLGDALLDAADGFRSVIEVARPFTQFVVDGIKKIAESFQGFATSQKGRDEIGYFLLNTRRRMEQLAPVLKNFIAGIGYFFQALNSYGGGKDDFTTYFNNGLLNASKSFKALGDQARDPNGGFQKWLRDVRPLLHDVVEFLKSAGKFFGDLFSDPDNLNEASKVLQQISQKWLPALAEIFDKLSQSGVLSKLATGISGVFDGINNFFDSGGLTALSTFGTALELIGTAISAISGFLKDLTDKVPILGSVFTGLGTLIAVIFGAALIAKFTGIIDIVKVMIGFLKGSKNVLKSVFGDVDPNDPKNNKPRPPKTPTDTPDKPGRPNPVSGTTGAIQTILLRCEKYLIQIARNTGGLGSNIDPDVDNDPDGKGKNKPGKGGKHRPGKSGSLVNIAEEVGEGAAGAGATSKAGGFFNGIKKFFGGGGGAAATEVAEGAGKGGVAARAAAGLLEGAKGGIIAAALTAVTAVAAPLVVDHFVKNKKDAASVSNGLGTVASYAGTGALIGSVVPVIGTAAGGAIGGAIGAIRSLIADPNLRSFVGSKISTAGSAIKNFVTGSDKDHPGGSVTGALRNIGTVALGPIGALLSGTGIGGRILDSLAKAAGGIGGFFTKTIPNAFRTGVRAIGDFFTKDIPRYVARVGHFFTHDIPRYQEEAFDAVFHSIGRLGAFFLKDLPRYTRIAFRAIGNFFTVTLPNAAEATFHIVGAFFTETIPRIAGEAWQFVVANLWDPFVGFVRGIPAFFTETIPKWFASARDWLNTSVITPIHDFVYGIPAFFTETVPQWFAGVPDFIRSHIIEPLTNFFAVTLPGFFTTTLPNAIASVPGFIYDNLIAPVGEFFGNLASHVGDILTNGWDAVSGWARGLFNRARKDVNEGYNGTPQPRMSGGLITGIYQGVEDKARVLATPGEFMVRRSKVQQPYGKQFLSDYNEGRIDPAQFYGGLSASTAPQVMSIVPPNAQAMTGSMPSVVNNTINHAPLMGDVTIHNPVRETSDRSLRRQVQIANIRHRR